MSEILEHLFGSKSRARLLRFFIFNPEGEFFSTDIAKRNMLKPTDVRRELGVFVKIGFVKIKKQGGKKKYLFNSQFAYSQELRQLFLKAHTYPQCASLGKIKNIGAVKLAFVSGVFLNYSKGKIDLLVVADHVSRVKLANVIAHIEAEIGREVRFMLLTNEEMLYRMDMMDRFLIEFLSGPYDEVINRMPKLKNFINDFKK